MVTVLDALLWGIVCALLVMLKLVVIAVVILFVIGLGSPRR